jgi:hypothetical protein
MSKDSIAVINGHEYKYRYNPETKSMDYLGPVGDAPPLTQEEFRMVIEKRTIEWDEKTIGDTLPPSRVAILNKDKLIVYYGTIEDVKEGPKDVYEDPRESIVYLRADTLGLDSHMEFKEMLKFLERRWKGDGGGAPITEYRDVQIKVDNMRHLIDALPHRDDAILELTAFVDKHDLEDPWREM